ncbi:Uncharacterised protein [Klebsiella oxytoca]|nr:Uncharacterised protein [Klebsiella oxytoca]
MNTTLNKRWCLTALLALSAMVFYRIVVRQNGQAGH